MRNSIFNIFRVNDTFMINDVINLFYKSFIIKYFYQKYKIFIIK